MLGPVHGTLQQASYSLVPTCCCVFICQLGHVLSLDRSKTHVVRLVGDCLKCHRRCSAWQHPAAPQSVAAHWPSIVTHNHTID